jgi:hypothetical protein
LRYFSVIETLLRGRQRFFTEIRKGVDLEQKITGMLVTSYLFLGIYGLVMGMGHGVLQGLASSFKMPVLVLLTLAICAPSLHYLNILFGSRQTILQTLAIVLAGIATMAVLLFSFAPITLFFLFTGSSYEFFKLLNVFFCAVAGFLGVGFLREGIRIVTDSGADVGRGTRRMISFIWIGLFGFVGAQMAWTLSPFMGDPSLPFVLIAQRDGNFYTDVFQTLIKLIGF